MRAGGSTVFASRTASLNGARNTVCARLRHGSSHNISPLGEITRLRLPTEASVRI